MPGRIWRGLGLHLLVLASKQGNPPPLNHELPCKWVFTVPLKKLHAARARRAGLQRDKNSFTPVVVTGRRSMEDDSAAAKWQVAAAAAASVLRVVDVWYATGSVIKTHNSRQGRNWKWKSK